MEKQVLDTKTLFKAIIEAAEEFKAEDITALNISELSGFADYFVIMTGNSSTHIQAIAEGINLQCKSLDQLPNSVEGLQQGEWCLMDYGDVVIHIFNREKRAFYDLESLWREAPVVLPAPETEATPEA